MEPARFVTFGFLYSGVVLLAQYALFYGFRTDIGALAQLGVGLSVLAAGLFRIRNPEQAANNPAEWGALAYGMALLSASLTILFLLQLTVL